MPAPRTLARRRSRLAAVVLSIFLAALWPPSRALAHEPPVPATPAAPPALLSEYYQPATPQHTVKTLDETWHDAARNRDIPVRIYLPTSSAPPKDSAPADKPVIRFPVIIFSHGLGGSRETYAYFSRHLAAGGYIVINPSHPGSDTDQLRDWIKSHGGLEGEKPVKGADQKDGWLMHSINDPENLRNRPLDITFIIDQLEKNKATSAIADLSRVGVAGHSFGAYTAMAVGGLTIDLPDSNNKSFRDQRVKAVLPMSPEGPGVMGITDSSWDHFAVPVLFLTGTRDYGAGERSVEWRQSGFTRIHSVDVYLITLTGATHMSFGSGPDDLAIRERAGSRFRDRIRQRLGSQINEGPPDADQAHHTKMVQSLSLAFFDAYLRDDANARQWLQAYTLPKSTDYIAQFKPAATPAPSAEPHK